MISNFQYGFRKHTPTADALADVIESVSDNLEHLNKCAILSIDLSKAFDTFDLAILLIKLYIYGIRGT